jgi:histidine ammonia-lyase
MIFKYGKDWLTSGIALKLAKGHIKGVLSSDVRDKINASSNIVNSIIKDDSPIYGINTGFGPLCTVTIESEHLSELQHNLLLSHSVGVGKPISKELTKLMLILKVHSLSMGFSGIRIETLERLLWLIENEIYPIVPEQGSVGASGDLAPLAHLFLPLIGRGQVVVNNSTYDSIEILKKHDLKPIELQPKEGLALINGTQFILAHAIKVVAEMHTVLSHGDLLATMMAEGLKGSSSPFRPELHELRPFKGNIHVAARMHYLLHNSEINTSHASCNKVQDPYSIRCVPQVHGASRDAWLHLKERVEIEANSVTDNPIILPSSEAISGGNFHGQPLAMTLDYAKLAVAELGNIADRRIYLSMMGGTEGLPKLLVKDSGVNSGFMILQYTTAALVSENKSLCFPSSADSVPTSCGQEDHVSMGSICGRMALQVLSNLRSIQAIELICAAQAIDFAFPDKPHPIISKIHSIFREEVAFADKDRYFKKDIEAAHETINSGIILKLVKELTNNKYGGFRTKYDSIFEVY